MDFSVGDIRKTAIQWDKICQFIPRDLARMAGTIAEDLWRRFRFELRDGTNGFGDDFGVLTAPISFDEYLELKERQVELIGPVKALARVVRDGADTHIRFVCFEYDPAAEPVSSVAVPVVTDTREVVKVALADVTAAIRDGRSVSGLDRVHTALHGHVKHLCENADIVFSPDSNLPFLFGELLKKHPAFSGLGAHGEHVGIAIKRLSGVVDSLGQVRNRASMAHPNDALIEPAEANLFVNAACTLLTYLDQRMSARSQARLSSRPGR
jgi:hypothetical protein